MELQSGQLLVTGLVMFEVDLSDLGGGEFDREMDELP
jgi:hypothetical protein